jgi:hypothetical protein
VSEVIVTIASALAFIAKDVLVELLLVYSTDLVVLSMMPVVVLAANVVPPARMASVVMLEPVVVVVTLPLHEYPTFQVPGGRVNVQPVTMS